MTNCRHRLTGLWAVRLISLSPLAILFPLYPHSITHTLFINQNYLVHLVHALSRIDYVISSSEVLHWNQSMGEYVLDGGTLFTI